MRPKKLVVPDLVELKIDVAQKVLQRNGFKEGKVNFVESYAPIDTVVSQYPIKGQLIDQSVQIKLDVCKKNYIRYLPTIYQLNSNFLKNFLWIHQDIIESITKKLDNIHLLFNPYTTREDFIPWLGMWLGIVFDPDLPLEKKRFIIKNAALLYSIRGTSRALKTWMKLITDLESEIIENKWPYKGFRIGVTSSISIDSIILPPMNLAHCFIVKMPVRFEEISEEALIKIHRVIQNEKPAHTNYFLQFKDEEGVSEYKGFLWVGVTSRIGTGKEVKPSYLPSMEEGKKEKLLIEGEKNE